jgi:hypothetical protein
VDRNVGDIYSFKLTDEAYKGLQQVGEEMGVVEGGTRLGAKAKKKKVSSKDIFIDNDTKELLRVMKVVPDTYDPPTVHKKFRDLQGTIVARPFVFVDGDVPQFSLHSTKVHDRELIEDNCTFVRPSSITVTNGSLGKSADLRVYVDVPACEELAAGIRNNERLPDQTRLNGIYWDEDAEEEDNLQSIIGKLPMFVNELPLIEQIVKDYGNILAVSPIVHCEIAGRGVEYANGRAKWHYRDRCCGDMSKMESLCKAAYGRKNIPQELMAKYERRVRDYMRAYRMGVPTTSLEKMRGVIKTHRNMIDSYEKFIKSETTDDPDTDLVIDFATIFTLEQDNK